MSWKLISGVDFDYKTDCNSWLVVQDNYGYPILHDETGVRSEHLETAKNFYDKVRQTGAKRAEDWQGPQM